MGASSLLRDSHRAAAIIQAGPWLRKPVTSAPPGPALLSIHSSEARAASHSSGELAAGSFTGMPAGRVEAQKGRCPLARPCMAYQYIWLSRLAFGQDNLDLRTNQHLRDRYRSLYRSFYCRLLRATLLPKQKRCWRSGDERRINSESRTLS